jgi:RNA polymerase sigma factor (sigma-70 family)
MMTQNEVVEALRRGDKAAVIEAAMPLIRAVANDSPFRFVPFDDRVQMGALRLWNSLDKYDPTRAPFSFWIRRSVKNAVRDGFYHYRTCHTPKRPYVEPAEVADLSEVEEKIELEQRLGLLEDEPREWLEACLAGEISASRKDLGTSYAGERTRDNVNFRRRYLSAKVQTRLKKRNQQLALVRLEGGK